MLLKWSNGSIEALFSLQPGTNTTSEKSLIYNLAKRVASKTVMGSKRGPTCCSTSYATGTKPQMAVPVRCESGKHSEQSFILMTVAKMQWFLCRVTISKTRSKFFDLKSCVSMTQSDAVLADEKNFSMLFSTFLSTEQEFSSRLSQRENESY